MAELIRLQKVLAECGLASRRKAEEMIAARRVQVNGRVAEIGDKVTKDDIILVDGEPVHLTEQKFYLALHKPRGFITTMQDERGRKCVASLVADLPGRIYPIGRLDRESEGLLLMTNDGEFANRIMHPSRHIPKTYRVTVRPAVNEEQLNRIASGMLIDGHMTLPARVKVLQEEPGRAVLEIVLYEGRNREIRKMCEALHLEVARLKRTAIGPVRLGMLKQGDYRELTKEEIRVLTVEAKRSEKKTDDHHSPSHRSGENRRRPGGKSHR